MSGVLKWSINQSSIKTPSTVALQTPDNWCTEQTSVETESKSKHREVPMEETAVETFGALKER
jgi:hypothetical protein